MASPLLHAPANHAPHEPAAPAPPAVPLMVLPDLPGAVPWTDKRVIDDPDRFQIGGHRPGIWIDAVNKLNMLRPSFVMSVGEDRSANGTSASVVPARRIMRSNSRDWAGCPFRSDSLHALIHA